MLKGVLIFGLTRRPIILLMLMLFIGGGLIAFFRLSIEAYPNPAPVILEITAQTPGLSAEEMERYFTIPIEVGLEATPGVENIRSTSFYGLSFVRVSFAYGVDYYFALTQAEISLQQNVSLPNNVMPKILGSSLVGEIYRYQLVGPPHFGLNNLRTIQDWILQRRLLSIPGVVQVNTWGGTTKEYEVEVDLQKLEAYNITLPQIVAAIGNANTNVGGRTLELGEQSVDIRGVGLIDSGGTSDLTQGYRVDDIESIVLAQQNGVPVTVKEVAHIYVGNAPRLGKAGRDHDDDVVAAIVVMNRTQHTNDVAPRIRAEVEKINSDGTLPPGVKVVPFYDRTSLIAVTTATVTRNLVLGFILIVIVQWLFLGDLRGGLIIAINIPFALFFTFIILVLRNEDANLLSFGAVDLGVIVDAAVILVESIYRNVQAKPGERQQVLHSLAEGRWGIDPTRSMAAPRPPVWTDRMRLILISALQIERTVLFSTAIIVAAFIPLFTMQGVEGQIFGPMAKTYASALIGALIATFTVTPCLASLLLPQHIAEVETFIVRGLRWVFRPVVNWSLSHRKVMATLGVIVLGLAGVLASQLGSEFLPELEEGNLWIRATMPPTISLEAGMPIVNRLREILLTHPEIITVVSQHGRPDNGSDATGFFNAEFFVPLKPVAEWPKGMDKEKLIDTLQAEFRREFLGVGFNFSQYIQDNIEEGLSGVRGANSAKVIGPDLAQLEDIARQAMHEMNEVKGITDLGIFWVLGQPNLNIKVDRAKASRYGLNAGDINTTIQAALGGATATTLLEADRQFNVVVRAAPEHRNSLDAIRNIKVGYQTPNGNAYIPLSELAAITLDTGSSYIYHERNQRFVPIKFSVRGRDLASAVAEAQARIAEHIKLPVGYRIEWAGEFESLQLAQRRLLLIVPTSLVLILVLIYGLFNSWRDSFLALFGIPFSLAGGIIALYIADLNFSISAAIGFISLFGVSVMSGIMMLSSYNAMPPGGLNKIDAMAKAVDQQMRPIMMMALSGFFGLLPAAVSTGIGSEVQRPLATVVVGGMLIGRVLMLLFVPPLQTFFLDWHGQPEPVIREDEPVRGEDEGDLTEV